MRFEIIEGRPWHCGQIARTMRREHREAVACLGIDSHREISQRFEVSAFRRAWLIDGKLAALGGITGSAISGTGFLWLALSESATRYPVAIIKEARRQLDEILTVKNEIVTTILDMDEPARRMAIFLGFHGKDRLTVGQGTAVAMVLRPEDV